MRRIINIQQKESTLAIRIALWGVIFLSVFASSSAGACSFSEYAQIISHDELWLSDYDTLRVSNNGSVKEISSPDVSIVFESEGFYGTDQVLPGLKDNNKYSRQYESIPMAGGGNYDVLYKALSDQPKATDQLTAKATFSNGKTSDDIIFKTREGTAVEAKWNGDEATIELKHQFNFVKSEIIATVKPADADAKATVAGKLDVWHFTQKQVNVTLVPIGGNISSSIASEINAIYNPAGVHFNVTVADAFDISQDVWDIDTGGEANKLDIGDSKTLANYTIEERAIYNHYKERVGLQEEMYYMFVIGKDINTTDPSTQGFMPLMRQYGFVFNPDNPARTIAHELGHGIFGLEHPFAQYGLKEKATKLLMDYGDGELFTHMDWQKMHAPALKLYIFQGDEDGELFGEIWLNANWEPFSFDKANVSIVSRPESDSELPLGAVKGLTYRDTVYHASGSVYVNKYGGTLDIIYEDVIPTDRIYLYKYNNGCGSNTAHKTTWGYVKDQKGKLTNVSFHGTEEISEGVLVNCIDKSEFTDNKCSQFVAYEEIQPEHQAAINKALLSAIASISTTSTSLVRDKGKYSHIQVANGADKLVKDDKMEVLEDKLHVLSHYRPDTYVVVTFLKIENNKKYESNDIAQMAEVAVEAANSDGKKLVNIIVPYSSYESIFGVGLFNRDACYYLGYGESQQGLITKFTPRNSNGSVFEDIMSLYKSLEKPVNIFTNVMLADGSVLPLEKIHRDGVAGLPFINGLRLLISPEFAKIDKLRSEIPRERPLRKDYREGNAGSQQYIDEVKAFEENYRIKKKLYDDAVIAASIADAKAVEAKDIDYFIEDENPVELREVFIAEQFRKEENNLVLVYSSYHLSKANISPFLSDLYHTLGGFGLIDSPKHFYVEIGTSSFWYGIVDVFSVVLSPFGLDFLPETIGFVYAVHRGDGLDAAGYAMSAVSFGVASYSVYKSFKLVKGINSAGRVQYNIKRIDAILGEGEEVVADVVGKALGDKMTAIEDAANSVNEVFGLSASFSAGEWIADGLDYLDNIVEWSDELRQALRTRYNSGTKKFKELFEHADDIQNLESAESWQVLTKSNLDDADPENVSIVSEYIKRSGKSAGDVIDEVADLSVDDALKWRNARKAEAFLNNHKEVYKAYTKLDDDLKGPFKAAFEGGPVKLVNALKQEGGVDAWIVMKRSRLGDPDIADPANIDFIAEHIRRSGQSTVDIVAEVKVLSEADVSKWVDDRGLESLIDGPSGLYDRYAGLSDDLRTSFRNDFARMTSDGLEVLKREGGFDAWFDLRKASRTGLAYDAGALRAVVNLRKHDNSVLFKLGLTPELIPFLEGQRSYADILADFEKLAIKLKEFPDTEIKNIDGIIARLDKRNKLSGGTGYSSSQVKGADGVVRAFADDIDDYVGETIVFEKRVENARNLNSKSYEDLQVELDVPGSESVSFRVEVKNCVNCVTSSVIKAQFIERDLYNATSLSQIRWRVYGQDFTMANLNTYLKANKEAIEGLGVDKVKQLFPDLDIEDANFVDVLISELNKKNQFGAIFKKN